MFSIYVNRNWILVFLSRILSFFFLSFRSFSVRLIFDCGFFYIKMFQSDYSKCGRFIVEHTHKHAREQIHGMQTWREVTDPK